MDIALVSLLLASKTIFVFPNSIKIKFSRPLLLSFRMFNPFVPSAPFLNPRRTSENLRISDVFSGQRKGALGTNQLILYLETSCLFSK